MSTNAVSEESMMRSSMWTRTLLSIILLGLVFVTTGAAQMEPQKIILDTDMGGDIDDAFKTIAALPK